MENSTDRSIRSTNQQQARHEALIETMNQFLQFQDKEGKPLLKKKENLMLSKDLVNLSVSEINHGVVILTDYFNLSGGSIGGVDLYKLLHAYFLDPVKRNEFNRILGY